MDAISKITGKVARFLSDYLSKDVYCLGPFAYARNLDQQYYSSEFHLDFDSEKDLELEFKEVAPPHIQFSDYFPTMINFWIPLQDQKIKSNILAFAKPKQCLKFDNGILVSTNFNAWYLPDMTINDAFAFKSMEIYHSALTLRKDARPDRKSIEHRCFIHR